MKRLFERLNLTLFLILTIFILSSWITPSNIEYQDNPSSFIGAELVANMAEEGNTKIVLKKYYSADLAEAPESEVVVIHEREIEMVYKYLHLKLTDQSEIKDENPSVCPASRMKSSCMVILTYEASVILRIMPSGYDVVWMQSKLNSMFAGLPLDEQPSLSLSMHIQDPMIGQINGMPETNLLQNYIFCAGNSYELPLSSIDPDGDKIRYELSSPYSFLKQEEGTTTRPTTTSNINELEITEDLLPPDIRFRRPPFKPLSNITEFAFFELNTQMKSENYLDSNAGILHFTPQTPGKYLIGITLIDERNGISVSNHQAVFLVDVI